MKRRHGFTLTGVAALVIATAPMAPASAEGPPVTVTYPSSCFDTTSLQQCIDSVSSGSTVYVDSTEPITEAIFIDKSLELLGSGAPMPTVSYGISAITDGIDEHITISRFNVGSTVSARIFQGSGHTIDISNVKVTPNTGYSAFYLWTEAEGTITLRNSQVTHFDTQSAGIDVAMTHPSGSAYVKVIGNRVTANGDPDAGGGIGLYLGHTGTGRVDVMNNSISDVAGCYCGAASGISAWRNASGESEVNIVGNSISRSTANGIYVNDAVADAGSTSVDLFNNVITKSALSAVSLESTNQDLLSVRAGYNDFWKNARRNFWDGESAGVGNLEVNPDFVDEPNGNLRIPASSPLVDSGLVCSAGGIATPDARGWNRVTPGGVDIGAFEAQSFAATGESFVGTSGPDSFLGTSGDDIFCGYGGADTLTGNEGYDYIDGGTGDDQLTGGPGDDLLFGRDGRDIAYGDDGADRISGGDGGDYCLAAKDFIDSNDRVAGGAGTDSFTADPGDERVDVENRGCFT